MTIPNVNYALDCENGGNLPCADDGGQMSYMGDGTIATTCTDGTNPVTFTTGHAIGTAPNDITFTPSAPVVVAANNTCLIDFNVEILAHSDDLTPNFVEVAEGWSGQCNNGLTANAGATAAFRTVSPDIDIEKEVSLDNVNFFDADAPPGPIGVLGADAWYRLTVTNTGNETLTNVVINDPTLGLMNVPLPASCLNAMGNFPAAAVCVLTSGEIAELFFDNRCDSSGVKLNTATVDGEGAGSGAPVSDNDPANLTCIEPAIEVTKDGPPLAKAGDMITYEICVLNTGQAAVENCSGTDTVLGALGAFDSPAVAGAAVCRDFMHTIAADAPDPLPNLATITCDVVGVSGATVNDDDDHSVNLFQPSINVTKTGDAEGKVGDEVCYDIGFTNTSSADTPALINCTGSDDVLGALGTFTAGVTQQFCRTIEGTDQDPLVNTATITCEVDGFDNTPSDSDSHSVDLFTVAANLTKECAPDPVNAGETIEWTITINNTGEKDLDCLVNDTEAGFVDEPLPVAAGLSSQLFASRIVEAGDAPVLSNTATAICEATGFDNVVDGLSDTADCEVIVNEEICRTPGFWGTHAGEGHPRATNLTQLVIDAAGGSLSICGETIDNTNVPDTMSAIEAMCVSVQGEQQLQLARQLTAAALNCVISGGGADCTGTSIESLWADANAACIANAGDLSDWIEEIDAFNNDPACHERELSESDVFDGVSPLPGPAGSSRQCNAATKNDVDIFD